SVTVLAAGAWEGGIEGVELPMLRTVLTPLVDSGVLPGVVLDALAHLALGGLYGSALYIARAADPEAARAEADVVLDVVLSGVQKAGVANDDLDSLVGPGDSHCVGGRGYGPRSASGTTATPSLRR
ncbi:MAG: hypothetical protein ACRDSE_22560, partial [Pseudonocardiaceae bacterium]